MKKLLYLFLILGLFACTDDEGNPCIYDPTLITSAVTDVTENSATLNGTISVVSENCDVPNNTEQGFVYATTIQPTINDNQVNVNGTSISITIENLEPETTYYVRAFLTNALGDFYSNEASFTTLATNCGTLTDINGNIYETVLIYGQCWTKTNANLDTYRDGTSIPQVTNQEQWSNLTTGAWCYYNNDSNNGGIYGKLYNWYAIAGIHDNNPDTPNKVFAPEGYHVPTKEEWAILIENLGGTNDAGGKLKSTSSYWSSPNTGATNESLFSALPAGIAHNFSFSSQFLYLNNQAWFWSQTEESTTNAWFTFLLYNSSSAFQEAYDYQKLFGFSVRFISN
jgi:uncharacterized protein (TIGR02145 family)